MNNKNNLSLEDAMNSLNSISKKIENESISIDEMIDLFEEGTKLAILCKNKIKKAEEKIISLSDLIKDEQ